MSPDVALQKALLARLEGDAALIALVDPANMRDGWGVPQRFPSISIGEGQVVRDPLTLEARHRRAYATLHVWAKAMPAAREIGGAIAAAVEGSRLVLEAGHHVISAYVSSSSFLRDPDGETAHGIVTVECLIEVAS